MPLGAHDAPRSSMCTSVLLAIWHPGRLLIIFAQQGVFGANGKMHSACRVWEITQMSDVSV